MLDTEDGLSWETFCDCSTLYLADSALLKSQRGEVKLDRRNAIRFKLREMFHLMDTD